LNDVEALAAFAARNPDYCEFSDSNSSDDEPITPVLSKRKKKNLASFSRIYPKTDIN
jgi:hypothetical protein